MVLPVPKPVPWPPGHNDIARIAYGIYVAEGRPDGAALDHWVRAERELGLLAPIRRARGGRVIRLAHEAHRPLCDDGEG